LPVPRMLTVIMRYSWSRRLMFQVTVLAIGCSDNPRAPHDGAG
jgi:hypothetical protein